MFTRPIVAIAAAYAILIIAMHPLIPEPPMDLKKQEDNGPISKINSCFMSVIQKTTPAPYDALLGSVVFGTSVSPIDPDLKEKYKKVGLVHLLVASGTQVSILIGVCMALVRSLKIPVKIGVIGTSIINLVFALMAGCGASIVRAAIMGEIALVGLWINRDGEAYTSLAFSALLLMIFNPLVLFDIGFQLTFAATWSLFYLAPIVEERLANKLGPALASVLSVSIAPILATTPITMFNFNQLSLIAVLVNAIVLPWVEVLTVLGFVSTALGAVFLPAACVLNGTLYLILVLLNEIVYFFSSLPCASIYIKQINFLLYVGYYMMLIRMAELFRRSEYQKIRGSGCRYVLACLAIILLFTSAVSFGQGKSLKISVIDVGQGDSIFIESPSGMNMLIDGGPKYKRSDAGKKFVLPFLHQKGINKIDVLVLTHPHDDHVGGLPSVLKDLPVGLVLDSGQPHTSRTYLEFLKLIDSKKIPYKVARAGQAIDLGGGVSGTILNPTAPFIEESALNNNSIVIKLVYGKVAVMLTGDMEKEGESRVLKSYGGSLRCALLKAGHHGSRTSSSQAFLEKVKPEAAMISVGIKNKFHHPHPSTMRRFEDLGIKTYRTDLNGNIEVKIDEKGYTIGTRK